MNALQPLKRRRRASGLWVWLLVAMVLAQTLGFTHSIVHALAPLLEQPGERVESPRQAQEHARAATAWLDQAFSAHGDASDCRLYDQFSHGDGLPSAPVLCLPSLSLPVFLQAFEASLPLAAAALVRARGPPSVR